MLKRILRFAKLFLLPHLRWVLASLMTGLLASAVTGLGVPLMVRYVFPVVFHSGTGDKPELLDYIPQLEQLSPSSLLMLACASIPIVFILRGAALWLNQVVVSVLGIRILEGLRTQVFRHIQKLPLAYLEGKRKGDLLSRVVADTGNVQMVLTHISNDLVKQPITCACSVTAFIYLLIESKQGMIFFVCMVLIALAAWPVFLFGKRISDKAHRVQAGMGELNTVVQQNLETQREVRAYALEERQIADFDAISKVYCRNIVKMAKYQRALVPIMETVTSLGLVFLLVSGRLCGMDLTSFLALAAALFFTFDSMRRAGTAYNRVNEAQGAVCRLEEVLDEPLTIVDPETPVELPARVKGDISFSHVGFSYVEGYPVLQEINIEIPAGQIVGLVGPSGAGKTTFASLIPRFYEVSEGAVKIDGIDIREMRLHDLREQIALVGQQALLFSGSIRDNIAMGRPGATEEEIRNAADAAYVSPFLPAQSQGLDTWLGDGGSGLSGGQRQRIAIARAFVKDAPILILDEATASLDAESEREIQRELDSLARGRTTLIVAHRFSTIRNADRILVFDHGYIIGDGTHEQLYANCPLYRELYDRQGV